MPEVQTAGATVGSAKSFMAQAPWLDAEPDCLVVSCSDHRFEQQNRELARHLGFPKPHVVQLPGGAALTLPLVSVIGFLSKAVDKIIERVVEMKNVKTIICISHVGCGAYKTDGRSPLMGGIVKQLTGKTVAQVQQEHIASAARRIKMAIPGTRVRSFFADVVTEGDIKRVKYEEIPVR